MPKRIIICADGTGNEPTLEADSNVFKLYRALTEDSAEQVAYYDQGLGTEKRPLIGKAFGVGISKNIRDCYEFIVDQYTPGAHVYLFGFSRGAFTVRSLGGMIARCGLVNWKYRSLTKQAFRYYRSRRHPEKSRRFRQKFSVTLDGLPRTDVVHFIGVWDTVGALGLPIKWLDKLNPFRHRFHDTRLNQHVPYGYQALAIDDQRRTFHPTLWSEENVPSGQTIEQLWFAGMHSDVGGGYPEHQLSDIALEWIIEKAIACGMTFVPNWKSEIAARYDGMMHNSRSGWKRLYRRKVRDVAAICAKQGVRPRTHTAVRRRIEDPACDYRPGNLPAGAVG